MYYIPFLACGEVKRFYFIIIETHFISLLFSFVGRPIDHFSTFMYWADGLTLPSRQQQHSR